MLTNLDFLKEGEKFPPESELNRLKMYADNKALFEGEHVHLYRECLKRIERIVGNFENVVSYPIVLNFQKLMSLKIADLLLGEPPKIYVEDEESQEQIIINDIIRDSDLINTCYEIALDVSRYGDGLFEIYQKNGKNCIGVANPSIWFPVVNENSIKEITHHVLAWETKDNRLIAKIYTPGNIERREYRIDHGVIQQLISVDEEKTMVNDFSIIQVSNVTTSDRITGIDDYGDLDTIISDLMVRFGQVDRILDKHANPSMSGPATALEQDPKTGEWRLKAGNFFPRAKSDDPIVEYITWDGELTANFTQIERLLNMLYTLSEMGSALFGESSGNTGSVITAAALRIKMMTPLAKVNRIRMRFEPALKKALSISSQVGRGKKLDEVDISISWFDGLPSSTKDDADVIASRTGNKPTMSQLRALQIFDGMSKDKAQEELDRIREDDEYDAPLKSPPFAEADTAKDNTEVISDDPIIPKK